MVHDPKSSSRAYSSSRLYTAMPPESAARSALGSVCTAMAVICRGSVRSSGAKIATRPWYSPSEHRRARRGAQRERHRADMACFHGSFPPFPCCLLRAVCPKMNELPVFSVLWIYLL